MTLDQQGQVLAINDPACRHYGYRREDFLTLQITDIEMPADAVKVLDPMARLDQSLEAAFEVLHRGPMDASSPSKSGRRRSCSTTRP